MSGRAVVVGGGLHGLSTAMHLARAGWHVMVLERRHVGRHSSGMNAGGVRRLGRDPAEIGLSMVAAEMWARIESLVGGDCGFRPTGQVKLAESDADMATLAARVELVRGLGWQHEELIDASEVRRLLPAVASHVCGGLVVRGDGSADPMRTVMAFRGAAVAAGVELREGVAVTDIERRGGSLLVRTDQGELSADRVANCAGAWAAALARMLGDDIPCESAPLMMIVTERMPRFIEPTVGATSRPLSFKQTDAGTVLIGGGMLGRVDVAAEWGIVNFLNLAKSARIASELFPIMRGVRMVRSWCGIEATTPDELPVLGESPACPGVFHSFGYSGHGFQLSPAAGAAVAELMARGETNLPVAGFATRSVRPAASGMTGPVLEVEGLRTEFRIDGVWRAAVDGVSLTLQRGETLALVGESGCGKSMTALSIMGLVSRPAGRISSGAIRLEGKEIVGLPESRMEKLRGDRMAMIFQEPMTSLNPVMTIGDQVAEVLLMHRDVSKVEAARLALAVLEEVKIPSAPQRFHDYPHQFSGGMRQRVMIAIALACEPALLLADEPTTALDVTIQAQVLGLLADLKGRHGMAMLFITHNLGVVAQIADRVAVMYAGEIVEQAPVERIFSDPAHPYTRALFAAIPRMDLDGQELAAIPGRVPALDAMPDGCRFAPRCPLVRAGCERRQALMPAASGHLARCHVATGALVDA